jgi:hypothetical protein
MRAGIKVRRAASVAVQELEQAPDPELAPQAPADRVVRTESGRATARRVQLQVRVSAARIAQEPAAQWAATKWVIGRRRVVPAVRSAVARAAEVRARVVSEAGRAWAAVSAAAVECEAGVECEAEAAAAGARERLWEIN